MTYTTDDVVQYFDFFDQEDFEEIQNKTGHGSRWSFGHTSLGKEHPEYHSCTPFWKIDFAEDPFFYDHLLNKIQKKLNTRFKLQHTYANGHTFGQDGSIHVDAQTDNGRTLLLYVNPRWHPMLGGPTNFYINDGEVHGVFPKANKAVLFPGKIPHCAAPCTRNFKGLRVTVAWKLFIDD
jgi:hypothetical protein